jgi:hypothetical protein
MFTLRLKCAEGWCARAAGLLICKKLEKNEALWIHSCRAIHTFGMRYPIAVYFVDKNYRVISFIPEMKPFRFAWNLKAASVIEMLATNQPDAYKNAAGIEALLIGVHSDLVS